MYYNYYIVVSYLVDLFNLMPIKLTLTYILLNVTVCYLCVDYLKVHLILW